MLQYEPILTVLDTTKTIKRIRIFHTSLDIIKLLKSNFVEYPHYPSACCFPHLCTMAHHCHGKKINLMAKRETSRQKEKPHGKKKNLTAKRKTSQQKERPTAKFLQCREDIIFLFFSLLPWGYSFCHESFSFCPEVFLFALRLIPLLWQSTGPPYLWNSVHKDSWFFSTCGYSWELAQTFLI